MAAKVKDAKAKEKRQRQILAGGVVLLAILLYVQLPKVLNSGGPSAAPPPPPTATSGTVDTGTASSLGAPSVAAASTTTSSPALADTGLSPTPQTGQLVHFDLFASKDPFVQQVRALPDSSSSSGGSSGSSGSTTSTTSTSSGGGPFGSSGGPTTTTTPTPTGPMTMVARLSVDGSTEEVVAGAQFPFDAPVFQLESFDASTARITVVGGQYQDGSSALPLRKGKPVTLQNTADGTRYTLVYLGRAQVPTASLPTTSTATTATTPAPAPAPLPPTTTTIQQ